MLRQRDTFNNQEGAPDQPLWKSIGLIGLAADRIMKKKKIAISRALILFRD